MTAAVTRLRTSLTSGDVVQAPGVFDAVSARLASEAGFACLHLSGAVTSAVALGLPDLGYLHGTDVADLARRITGVTDVPLIADADTGYGNALHARRTVEQYARSGIAGLHIEDQVSPKRCGHMAGKAVITREDAVEKIRAASEADADLVIIARTDALSVLGIDEAISRVLDYAEAGADLIFVEGATDREALDQIHQAVPQIGKVINVSEADAALRPLPLDVLASYGVRLALYPVAPLLAAAQAVRNCYAAIRQDGNAGSVARMSWDELTDLLELPALLELEKRYA